MAQNYHLWHSVALPRFIVFVASTRLNFYSDSLDFFATCFFSSLMKKMQRLSSIQEAKNEQERHGQAWCNVDDAALCNYIGLEI